MERQPVSSRCVAVLHQAVAQPSFDGVSKPPKPNGYADSCADIAFTLRARGVRVLTPVASPDPAGDLDWSFPDTSAGIAVALAAGANVLWANTNPFALHPLALLPCDIAVVGHEPARAERIDDKAETTALLAAHHLPIPRSGVLSREAIALATAESLQRDFGLAFPLILKPVRGRGSQGVVQVHSIEHLKAAADSLPVTLYGSKLMLEEFLPGTELTIAVLPPGTYSAREGRMTQAEHWALPPVLRTGHADCVLPYSGDVPVTANSRALSPAEVDDRAVCDILAACCKAAALLDTRAVIRIDVRQGADGVFRLFDFNLKPNMTGPNRPGRDDQASLVAIAAEAIGWDYGDLLLNLLAQASPFGARQRPVVPSVR